MTARRGEIPISRRLQARVLVLMVVGVVVPLVALGIANWRILESLRRELAEERRLLASSFAEQIDEVVRTNLALLQSAATAPGVDPADGDAEPEHAALRSAFVHAHQMQRVFALDVEGTIVAEEPAGGHEPGSRLQPDTYAQQALTSRRPTVSSLHGIETDEPRVYMFVPIHDWSGRTTGVIGGEFDPREVEFASLLRPFRNSPGGSVDLVDVHGVILLTTEPHRTFSTSTAAGRVATVIEAARQRREAARAEPGEAIAPLASAPWAIVVQERGGESTAALAVFRHRLAVLVPLLAAIGALFAWGAARSVTRPIVALTQAADGIRAGELGRAIPPLGDDEIGRLGQALEAMRLTLKASIDEVARANQDLERRVETRTRELEEMTRELRKRDETRGWLLQRVISAQEDERRRIARELHDETSQTLSALAMGLETTHASAQTEAMRGRLAEAKSRTRRAIDELHRLMHDLRPSVLDDLGLLPAIRWFAERTLRPLGIAVRCECPDVDQRFRPEFEIGVFRVAQEAITNIAKHARAETVLVECAVSDYDLVLEFEDDGCGFDPQEVATSPDSQRGLGLAGMRERVDLLGGTLRIDSAPGRGTYVSVKVPIPTEVAGG